MTPQEVPNPFQEAVSISNRSDKVMVSGISTLKKSIKKLTGKALCATGLFTYLAKSWVPVVAFHRVNNRGKNDGLTCDVKTFKEFCRVFSQEFDVVSIGTLTERLKRREGIKNLLAITFDDGYVDNYEEAAPILQQFGLPATFFVSTGFIDTDLIAFWDEAAGVREKWMTWAQVSALHRTGFEIGAHTRTHVDLGKAMPDVAWSEIVGSRLDLEVQLGIKATSFAYPFGRQNHLLEGNLELVRQAGFECCCSCYGGINHGNTNVYNLHRIPIGSWFHSPLEFVCELLREPFR